MEISSLQTSDQKQEVPLSVRDIVAKDLEVHLQTFKDPKKGMRMLASQMGIHQKTFRRLVRKENTPGYLTLYKIYRVLFNTNNDAEVLEMVHPVIAEEIKKLNPKKLNSEINYLTDVEELLLGNPVACEIYMLAGVQPIDKEVIAYRYGTYGIDTLNQMIKDKVLQILESGKIALGINRTNFSSNLIKTAGLNMVSRYSNIDNDERGINYLAIYGTSLSEQAYNDWLKIDEEAYYKKVELSKKSENSGPIRAFTFIATDTMQETT